MYFGGLNSTEVSPLGMLNALIPFSPLSISDLSSCLLSPLPKKPEEWQYSGAYHREHGITKIVSLVTDSAWKTDLKLLL
jgi:hypothetical protein